MKYHLLLLCFLIFSCTQVLAQKTVTLRYHDQEITMELSETSIAILENEVTASADTISNYRKAWCLGTVCQMHLILGNSTKAENFYDQAKDILMLLKPEDRVFCVYDLARFWASVYMSTPNSFNMNLELKLNDIAVEALAECDSIKPGRIESLLFYFLANNSAAAWKYDYYQAMDYFVQLMQVYEPILQRSVVENDFLDVENVKDVVRNSSRFMNDLFLNNKQMFKNLCSSEDCLERSWASMQMLKSLEFKSLLIANDLSRLPPKKNELVQRQLEVVDSVLHTDTYFKGIILAGFNGQSREQYFVDSLRNEISTELSSYNLLVSSTISLKKIQEVLQPNEVYISVMYSSNMRSAYGWKITKKHEPEVIKLGINSNELFFRTEYYKNRIINRPDHVEIVLGDTTVYNYDLAYYLEQIYDLALEEEENATILYNKLISTFDVTPGQRLIIEVDQNLASFPFGTLKNPKTERYLAEENVIMYTPSAGIFYKLRTTAPNDYHSYDYTGLSFNEDSALSYVDSIILSSVNVWSNENKVLFGCTETGLYANRKFLDSSAIIHFACHSHIDNSISGLVLGKDSLNDGLLENYEILSNFDLSANLVVLTSCNTAPYIDNYQFIYFELKNDTLFTVESCVCNLGETFSRLTSAFFAAGANKVLATQWDIPDSPISAAFMNHFFSLLATGVSEEEALISTQKKFSISEDIQYWGGYILVGD